MLRNLTATVLGLAFFALLALLAQHAAACPFCAAVSQTFSEEIDSMDVVVIARLVESPPVDSGRDDDFSNEVAKAKFEIVQTIKGSSHLDGNRVVETIYFGTGKVGETFLIMGVDPPKVMWSTPLQLSDRAVKYITQLDSLPKKGADRLAFFQDYLEDEDEMLARDAYDEFARAPYEVVKALKDRMKHDQLIAWIKDPEVPASRRRLYLTMLGVCGSENDLPMLEEMLQSKDRQVKAGLDAMIGCYLTIKGPEGMPLIEDLFLKNKKAEYADTYAAIMALRFHGGQTDVIPRKRVIEGLRHMLERPELADLVIPDLARWEDWSAIEKLVQLFKNADEKSSWVRVPVINYLRACPLPESKKYIEELEKIDPAAVKRAKTYFPYGPAGSKTSENWQRPKDTKIGVVAKNSKDGEAAATSADQDGDEVASAELPRIARRGAPAAGASPVVARTQPNTFTVLGVSVVAGVFLMLLLWMTLRGAGRATAG